eukprot:7073864-Prymnesium_polylepis.1
MGSWQPKSPLSLPRATAGGADTYAALRRVVEVDPCEPGKEAAPDATVSGRRQVPHRPAVAQ